MTFYGITIPVRRVQATHAIGVGSGAAPVFLSRVFFFSVTSDSRSDSRWGRLWSESSMIGFDVTNFHFIFTLIFFGLDGCLQNPHRIIAPFSVRVQRVQNGPDE